MSATPPTQSDRSLCDGFDPAAVGEETKNSLATRFVQLGRISDLCRQTAAPLNAILQQNKHKVFTVMAIGPLDDCTNCHRSAFTLSRIWLYDCLRHHFTASRWVHKYYMLTFSSNSNRLAEIWHLGLSIQQFGGMGVSDRLIYLIARQWVPIS